MFDNGGWQRPERKEEKQVKEITPAPRFSPRVIAAQLGRPIPEYTRDRIFNDGLFEKSMASDRVKAGKAKRAPKGAAKEKKKPSNPKPMNTPLIMPPPEAPEAGPAAESIQSTCNYKRFKLLATNRPVDPKHVSRLVAAIRKKNLLNLQPIVVNENDEVIDGQHRLAAAERLHVEIFFTKNAEINQDDIAGLNSNKKNWGLVDYIHFFASQGKADYVTLTELFKQHPGIPQNSILSICTKDGKVGRGYKDGTLDLSGLETAKTVLSYLPDFIEHTEFAKSGKFVEALAVLVRSGKYDHEHMQRKLETNADVLQLQASVKEWVLSLQRIYNRYMPDAKYVTFMIIR